jgi:hypothetical protein
MMTARLVASLVAALAAAQPVLAEECPQELAIYTERDNGYELRFRTPEPWEAAANVSAIIELAFPGGETVWGTTWTPNGTSWNQASLFSGCRLPGPIDSATGDPLPGSAPEELAACQIWEGVIYRLADTDVAHLPFREDPAASAILLTNLGPTVRYSGLVASPGDEPHDVFTLSGCAAP